MSKIKTIRFNKDEVETILSAIYIQGKDFKSMISLHNVEASDKKFIKYEINLLKKIENKLRRAYGIRF